MKFRIQNASYFPKPYWLVANSCAALILLIVLSASAAADQFNDANYFEEGGVPVAAPSGGGGGGGGSGSNAFGGFGGSGSASGGGQSTPSPESSPADTTDTDAGSTSPGSGIETEEELIDLLTTQGTVTVVGGPIEEEGVGSGGGFVTVDGAKVRASAKNDPDIDKVLKYWRGLGKTKDGAARTKGRLTTGEYYLLVAAELASGDEQLERATLEASRFKITYRSRGVLFAFIPISFPVRIEVTGAATSAYDRVKVHLPWYRFFIRKYFSAKSLADEVDVVVAKKLAGLDPDATDVQAVLFTTVADFLKQKVRTISDSILLAT